MDAKAAHEQFVLECETLNLDPAQTTLDDLKRAKTARASQTRRERAWARRQPEEEGAQHPRASK